MITGILVKQNGECVTVEYDQDDMRTKFRRLLGNVGFGEMELINSWRTHGTVEKFYVLYGWKNGSSNFNQFEFHTHVLYGDALVVSFDTDELPVNIETSEFDDRFSSEDLDDMLIDDELEWSQEGMDSYDYGDGFLVRDDVDDGGQDGMDYEMEFSDDELY